MISINSNTYTINIGVESVSMYDFSNFSNIAILVDENTKKYCLPIFLKDFQSRIDPLIIEIKSGENNKSIKSCIKVWNNLIENSFDRQSLIVNLGGGVICDLGGFSAANYKRGISFINVPTSLLAMVDASYGGKVGVNINKLKNQIGYFKNPADVLVNPIYLNTLPNHEVICGFAEIIKHALISDIKYWKIIKDLDLVNVDNLEKDQIIERSIIIKNHIILEDPFEIGNRKKLNFGHTFGHAIESYYMEKSQPISHGHAILIGILLECELSNMDIKEKLEIKNFILSKFKLPYTPSTKELKRFLIHDKKNIDGQINFSLLTEIGKCEINNLFNYNEL